MKHDSAQIVQMNADHTRAQICICFFDRPISGAPDHQISLPPSAASFPLCFKGVLFFQSVASVWTSGKVFPFIGVEYF